MATTAQIEANRRNASKNGNRSRVILPGLHHDKVRWPKGRQQQKKRLAKPIPFRRKTQNHKGFKEESQKYLMRSNPIRQAPRVTAEDLQE